MSERVNYSYSVKINTGPFESTSVSCSLTSDVKHDETREQAVERISKFVEGEVQKKEKQIRKSTEVEAF